MIYAYRERLVLKDRTIWNHTGADPIHQQAIIWTNVLLQMQSLAKKNNNILIEIQK